MGITIGAAIPMISSIEIRNWKTHENTRIEFSRGTNILVGMMGAGKSSTIDAICYGLFGTFPLVKHKKVKFSDIIRNRPRQEREAAVKVTFTVDSDEYTVERDIALNGSGKARLSKNGAYVQSQPERVNEEIEGLLKVDYDLFARAVYSEQNRLDYFLEIKAKDRKDQIDELLGLDKFSLASDNAGSLINKVKEMVANQKEDMEQLDVESARNQLAGLELELEKLVFDKEKIIADLASADEVAKTLKAKVGELKDKESKRNILTNEITQLKSSRDYAQLEIQKIEEKGLGGIKDLDGKIMQAQSRLDSLNVEHRKLLELENKENKKLGGIDSEILQLEKKILEKKDMVKRIASRDIETLKKEYEGTTHKLDAHKTELLTYTSEKKNAEKTLSELKEHISKCPICEREISKALQEELARGKKARIDELSKGIGRSEKAVDEWSKKAKLCKEEMDSLSIMLERIHDYEGIEARKTDIESGKKTAKAALDEYKIMTDKISKDIEVRRDSLQKLMKACDELKRREGYLKDISKFDIKIKSVEQGLNSVNVDPQEIEKLQKDLGEVKTSLGKLSAESAAHERYIEDKRAAIKDKREHIARVENINKDIKHKEMAISNLVRFRESLDETKLVLRNKLVESVNSIMQSMWSDLYPYGDYRSIMLNATADDYTLMVLTNKDGGDRWQEVDSIASGGERSTACLALRVAFSLVLVPNLKWIILDEPTHNIDEDGIKRFISLFNERLPRIIDQIFIITHDELLKQAISSNVYVLSRNKDEDGSTIIQRA